MATLTVDGCDYCGLQHQAEPAHRDAFNGAQLYAVVCGVFTDFYTAERVQSA